MFFFYLIHKAVTAELFFDELLILTNLLSESDRSQIVLTLSDGGSSHFIGIFSTEAIDSISYK